MSESLVYVILGAVLNLLSSVSSMHGRPGLAGASAGFFIMAWWLK